MLTTDLFKWQQYQSIEAMKLYAPQQWATDHTVPIVNLMAYVYCLLLNTNQCNEYAIS